NEKINTPSLTGYKLWLAQYAATPTYTRTKYDMWQYSSTGKVSGISGNVDMNISYLGY
ncbi:MAG: endolysin, partial [Lachnospiraceae bacterium]|nr:endolysin [Lachnospiraceae bacterium]